MKITELQKESESMPQMPMPCFRSHKKVWALKIAKVHIDDDGQGIALQFENPNFALRAFTSSQLEHKPLPEAGMYFVQYEDEYFSFSPGDVFENDYSPLEAEPIIEKVTVSIGKPWITPAGEVNTVHIIQASKWGGILGEISLTGPQALRLAQELQAHVRE